MKILWNTTDATLWISRQVGISPRAHVDLEEPFTETVRELLQKGLLSPFSYVLRLDTRYVRTEPLPAYEPVPVPEPVTPPPLSSWGEGVSPETPEDLPPAEVGPVESDPSESGPVEHDPAVELPVTGPPIVRTTKAPRPVKTRRKR